MNRNVLPISIGLLIKRYPFSFHTYMPPCLIIPTLLPLAVFTMNFTRYFSSLLPKQSLMRLLYCRHVRFDLSCLHIHVFSTCEATFVVWISNAPLSCQPIHVRLGLLSGHVRLYLSCGYVMPHMSCRHIRLYLCCHHVEQMFSLKVWK